MPKVLLRPPTEVMNLSRMGVSFSTRISFMRRLIRLMHRESWQINLERFGLDEDGYGVAVYVVATPERAYSLICFSHYIDPRHRTDRVIAEAWDTTFSLFDGVPTEADINRLSYQTPKQEAGRFRSSELVLSRANKSLRLFGHVVDRLAAGKQPTSDTINAVGYLMRTTAVYSNGKFGMADRTAYASRTELAAPYQAEMLTVYLIRTFTIHLVEHLARRKNPKCATTLNRHLKRHLGIGNATGLGMAPFLLSHPMLIHNWFYAREAALAKIRSLELVTIDRQTRFRKVLVRARQHISEWTTNNEVQNTSISSLRKDLELIAKWTNEGSQIFKKFAPWNTIFELAKDSISIEGQELLVSLLLEPYPEIVDQLGENLQVEHEEEIDLSATVNEMREMIEIHYSWALQIDVSDPHENRYFWYYSKEKLEPRRGVRGDEPGSEKEMKISVAHDVHNLYAALKDTPGNEILAVFLIRHLKLRHVVRRVQIGSRYSYAEIHGNLLASNCKPSDVLRSKLAFFGASKFDPKSSLWTRITMYQGAPLEDELKNEGCDDWSFPIRPTTKPCKSH